MSQSRLNKHIADSGLCSRREADRLIEGGKVTVNGRRVKTLGLQINPETDEVRVSGNPLPRARKLYLLFHKPVGYMTTRSDEKGRKTIYGLLDPKYQSADPAGRLDKASSGALILSTDGDFVYRLTHPKFHLPKVYRVALNRPVTEEALKKLAAGVRLMPENKLAKAESVEVIEPALLEITLITGYNRQIRRSLEMLGFHVESLKRVAIGSLRLGNLAPGKARPLTREEIRAFRKSE